LIKLITIKL